jgi:hypothetical protein
MRKRFLPAQTTPAKDRDSLLTGVTLMDGTPNTIGLILLFIVVFLACLLWATRGHTAHADTEEQDVAMPGKSS